MEIAVFSMEYSLSSLFLILAPFFLSIILKNILTKCVGNLPPGPRRLPIIGNLHQIGEKPHVSTAIFAQEYGPLISLRLGTRILVVASSPEAAAEILKTQDRFLSGRSTPDAYNHSFVGFFLVWAKDCNEHWKSLRTLCRADLFSPKALEVQSSLRNKKLSQMLDFLHTNNGKLVAIEEVIFSTLLNTLSNVLFSKDLVDLNDEHVTGDRGIKWSLVKALENAVTPNISDFFPMIAGFDLQRIRKNTLKHFNTFASFIDVIIKGRRARIANSTTNNIVNSVAVVESKDFLDRLIESEFTDEQINILAMELFAAGTDTVITTIEWAMSELLKNKDVMSKLRQELENEFHNDCITESALSRLTYLNACIKETLRLHPVVPVLIPRRATETCEIMNYTIPQDAQIWINVWAISRDPKVWKDPFSFKPERFNDSNLDFKGQDFEFIPFGAGRRMCPGLPSGIISVQSILASLVLRFDWVLPNDEDPKNLDMNEKFGVTLQRAKPLQLIFKPRE